MTELQAVKANVETVLSDLRNGLMICDAIDPMKQGSLSVLKDIEAVGTRIRNAIIALEDQERQQEAYFAGVQKLKVEKGGAA